MDVTHGQIGEPMRLVCSSVGRVVCVLDMADVKQKIQSPEGYKIVVTPNSGSDAVKPYYVAIIAADTVLLQDFLDQKIVLHNLTSLYASAMIEPVDSNFKTRI